MLVVPTGAAASLAKVGSGDGADQKTLMMTRATLGFLDFDGDGFVDHDLDEGVYLDLDATGTVTFGDLRITTFASYGAGTLVGGNNTDVDRALTSSRGWLGQHGNEWHLDMDDSHSISVGDVQLAPVWGAPDLSAGSGLAPVQSQTSVTSRIGFLDEDGDGRLDATEALYLDLDAGTLATASRVSPGDLRITTSGFPVEHRAVAREGAHTASASATSGSAPAATTSTDEGGVPAAPAWRSLDWLLIALAIVNLVGLVVVYRLFKTAQPRNPFK